MMKMILFVSLFLAGCGCQTTYENIRTDSKPSSDPELLSYMLTLEDMCRQEVAYLPVTFMPTEPEWEGTTRAIAYCYSSVQRIEVSRVWWDKSKEESRLAILLHEVGHCRFQRPDIYTMSGDCPATVMYYLLGGYARCHKKWLPNYVEELCNEKLVDSTHLHDVYVSFELVPGQVD